MREEWIDEAKGRLIFLVVLGHSLQYLFCHGANYWDNLLFSFIYSFHMPLFALLSGYLAYGFASRYNLKEGVCIRFLQILIPCFAWAGINYGLGILIGRNSASGIINFIKYWIHSNWYLWAMFYCTIAILICTMARRYWYVVAIIMILLCLVTPDIANTISFKMMFPFFAVGYAIKKYGILRFVKNIDIKRETIIIILEGIAYLLITLLFIHSNFAHKF